ncbi:ribosome-binding protein 1-like isoform X4 [Pecten maximus]|uniref:ribosome-binding protein 1-like isoform X4 n=1 Tax=Pecten maximus TaxID=6579 RepID=UPI001458DC69|nr:ribosome-binding protein 1-like isoform X4 [Pecten maximus]
MDPHTVLIGIAVFCLSALLIYLISIFGIKEKTFEEALAEQKQRLEDEKQKEKSLKKAEKEKKKFRKSKEKPKEKGLQVSEPELPKEQKMVNLEIDPEIIEPLTDTSSTEGKRSQNTKKKPKSILHNKNEEPHVTKETQQVVHHIPVPKDELEILHDHEKDQKDVKKDKSAPKASKKGKEEVKSTPKRPIVMEEEIIVPKYENVSHTASYSSPDSKMRIDPSQLVANIHTAPLTDSEIQNLIEVLLNKQGGASSSWNKKTQKGDDVKLLRKQLEEKERALQEEQKLAMQANACLSKEKAGYNTLEKQYQEKIAVQNSEIQALRSKMQHSIEQHMLERSSLQTRLQQLERQAGDQSLAQKLSEENKILKENLKRAESETVPQKNYASLTRELQIIQEELSKNVSRNTAAENAKKTLEEKLAKKDAELAKLKGSEKESEGVVTKRLDEVNKQLRKTEAENATLTNNLKTAERECSTVKARLQELEMALSGNDNTSKVLEEKLQGAEKAKSNVEASLKATEKKLVDAEQQKAKLEKEFEDAKKQKSEVEANLKSTEQKLTDMEQLQTKLQTDFESAEKVKSDMQSNLENLEQKLSETEQNKDKLQNEMEVLKQENSSLSQEMVVVKETVVKTAGAPNGDIHDEPAENKIAISQHEKIVSEKETEIKRLVADMEAKVSELSKLQGEVDKQKKKNNDLRQKNWEAMEALQKAEKSVTLQVQSAVKDTKNDESTALVTDAEKYDKTVLQKIFPDISVNTNLVHKEWMSCFEKEAIVQLQSLSSANESIAKSETKVTDLQGQVSSLETQVQELKSSLSSSSATYEDKVKDIQEKNSSLQSEVQRLKTESSNMSSSQARVAELEDSNKTLEQQVQENKQLLDTSCASYEAKVKALEEKNSSLHSEVDKLHSESSNVSSSDSRVTELEESNTKLETQVQEYLNVLATTESKLQQLENSVEGEEKKWHDKLQTVQIDLEQAKQEVSSLQDELKKSQANTEALSELEFAYRCLEKSLTQITDEMKEKVLSLEGQLKISEDKCSQLQSQVEESEEKTRELQESVKSTSNEEDLLKQIEELKKLLSEESKKSKNLATTNVRLNGIIKTGQDSLAQEQALVDKLKSEMEKSKGSNGAAPSSEIEQLRAKLEEKEKQLEKELLAKKQLSQRLAQLGVMASSQGNDLGTSV